MGVGGGEESEPEREHEEARKRTRPGARGEGRGTNWNRPNKKEKNNRQNPDKKAREGHGIGACSARSWKGQSLRHILRQTEGGGEERGRGRCVVSDPRMSGEDASRKVRKGDWKGEREGGKGGGGERGRRSHFKGRNTRDRLQQLATERTPRRHEGSNHLVLEFLVVILFRIGFLRPSLHQHTWERAIH